MEAENPKRNIGENTTFSSIDKAKAIKFYEEATQRAIEEYPKELERIFYQVIDDKNLQRHCSRS